MRQALRFFLLAILAAGMFVYPQDVVTSALSGIELWWRYVLPALFPFLILSELLMGGGFVHFLGALLEPLMRPLFRLPGNTSFVVAMGYTSGFPMGAILTARLRQEGQLTRDEGERLLAFTNNPSPGFIFGAVSSGMLGRPDLGIFLAASVYLANLTMGLLARFLPSSSPTRSTSSFSFRQAWLQMTQAQAAEQRSFGRLLSDAIRQSINTVLAVGGFIIFFAVIIRLLILYHFPTLLAAVARPLLGSAFSVQEVEALINGLMEMTLGCQSVIAAFSQLNTQFIIIAVLMGWGGLSVFAQVAGFISSTDLRFSRFFLARILHAFLAFLYSKIFLALSNQSIITFAPTPSPADITVLPSWLSTFQLSSLFFLFILCTFTLIRFLLHSFHHR